MKLNSHRQELVKHDVENPESDHEDDVILPAVTLSESHPNENDRVQFRMDHEDDDVFETTNADEKQKNNQ